MIVELVGWWETRRGRHIGCHAADGRHAGRRCVDRRGVGRHGRGGPGGGRGRTWAGVASMMRVPDGGGELAIILGRTLIPKRSKSDTMPSTRSI